MQREGEIHKLSKSVLEKKQMPPMLFCNTICSPQLILNIIHLFAEFSLIIQSVLGNKLCHSIQSYNIQVCILLVNFYLNLLSISIETLNTERMLQ